MATDASEMPLPGHNELTPSQVTLTGNHSRSRLHSSPSYVWTTNDSMLSGDVDRWIGGDTDSPTPTSMPRGRLSPSTHQSRIPQTAPLHSSRFWYVAAMVLPLFSMNGSRNWRCSPSAILNTAELMLTQMAGYCSRARSRLRRISRGQGATDLFAGAMDVVLVVYAIGFLLISLYQASVFHQL